MQYNFQSLWSHRLFMHGRINSSASNSQIEFLSVCVVCVSCIHVPFVRMDGQLCSYVCPPDLSGCISHITDLDARLTAVTAARSINTINLQQRRKFSSTIFVPFSNLSLCLFSLTVTNGSTNFFVMGHFMKKKKIKTFAFNQKQMMKDPKINLWTALCLSSFRGKTLKFRLHFTGFSSHASVFNRKTTVVSSASEDEDLVHNKH